MTQEEIDSMFRNAPPLKKEDWAEIFGGKEEDMLSSEELFALMEDEKANAAWNVFVESVNKVFGS